MTRQKRQAEANLQSLLSQGSRLLDDIENRGVRLSKLPAGSLHAIMGICSGYLGGYAASLAIHGVSFALVGTLCAGALGTGFALLGRDRETLQLESKIRQDLLAFDAKREQAGNLAEFIQVHGRSLPPEEKKALAAECTRLLTHSSNASLPPPATPSMPLAIPGPSSPEY